MPRQLISPKSYSDRPLLVRQRGGRILPAPRNPENKK